MFEVNKIQDYVYRFDINEDNFAVWSELLKLPYHIYKPIIELLSEEKITIEDLTVNGDTTRSNVKMFDERMKYSNKETMTESELKASIINLVNSKTRPTKVSLDREPIADAESPNITYAVPIDVVVTGGYENTPEYLTASKRKEEQFKNEAIFDDNFKNFSN